MKRSYLLPLFLLFFSLAGYAQNKPLPVKTFLTLRDSTTSMDVVMMQGKGGSLSLEGRNVRLFNGFFENKTSQKFKAPQAGNIMWLINGREFISGNYFLGDSTGYIVFTKDGQEYVNAITPSGTSFFKSQVKN